MNAPRDRAARAARAGRSVAVVAAALLLGACDGNPVGPPTSCALPTTSFDRGMVAQLSSASLHAAALDATERLLLNVNSGAAGSTLSSAVASLDQGVGAGDLELACRSAHRALSTLDGLAADPATAPDRSALRLVIELLTASLDD